MLQCQTTRPGTLRAAVAALCMLLLVGCAASSHSDSTGSRGTGAVGASGHAIDKLAMSVPVSIQVAPIRYGETAYGIIHLHGASTVSVTFSGDTSVLSSSNAQSPMIQNNFASFSVPANGGSPITENKYVIVTATTGTNERQSVKGILVVMPNPQHQRHLNQDRRVDIKGMCVPVSIWIDSVVGGSPAPGIVHLSGQCNNGDLVALTYQDEMGALQGTPPPHATVQNMKAPFTLQTKPTTQNRYVMVTATTNGYSAAGILVVKPPAHSP